MPSVLKDRELEEMRMILNQVRCQSTLNDWPSSVSVDNVRNVKKLSQSQEFVRSQALGDAGNLTLLENRSKHCYLKLILFYPYKSTQKIQET